MQLTVWLRFAISKDVEDDSKILESIGKEIKILRLTFGWSQEKLSEMSGVDRTFLGKVERGAINVSVLTLCEIAKALGVNIKKIIK